MLWSYLSGAHTCKIIMYSDLINHVEVMLVMLIIAVIGKSVLPGIIIVTFIVFS